MHRPRSSWGPFFGGIAVWALVAGCGSAGGIPDSSADDALDVSEAGGDAFVAPAFCSLPPEVHPDGGFFCAANFSMFAAVDGVCHSVSYGGCGGTENLFLTIEECLATCEGRPGARPCPEGRTVAEICVVCEPAGGCSKKLPRCVQPCMTSTECSRTATFALGCYEGVCQVGDCR
jgi:Kunitz/Bovine pancreatic trypsin inhibitor domain